MSENHGAELRRLIDELDDEHSSYEHRCFAKMDAAAVVLIARAEKAEEQRDRLKAALLWLASRTHRKEHYDSCGCVERPTPEHSCRREPCPSVRAALADEPSPSRLELALEKLNSLPAFDETVLVAPLDEPLDDGLCPTCPISEGCTSRWRNVKSCLTLAAYQKEKTK